MPIVIPVTGGTYTATPDEVFTIQAGMTGNITINGATDLTVNIAAGADTSPYAIDANGESLTLNIGGVATVGDIDSSNLDATGSLAGRHFIPALAAEQIAHVSALPATHG